MMGRKLVIPRGRKLLILRGRKLITPGIEELIGEIMKSSKFKFLTFHKLVINGLGKRNNTN